MDTPDHDRNELGNGAPGGHAPARANAGPGGEDWLRSVGLRWRRAGFQTAALVDKRVVPGMDLSLWRSLPALVGVAILLYGLVWETR